MVYRNDYKRSDTPMLPTRTTMRQSAYWILLHTGATAFAALLLAAHPALGWIYFLPVAFATIYMLKVNFALIAKPDGRLALKLFKISNLYLAVVLLMICVEGIM